MKNIKTLKDLALDHPYYCSQSNYFSNDATAEFDNWQQFYEEYKDAYIDYNLIFRWDIKPKEDPDTGDELPGYRMEVFIMQQRKGVFMPNLIAEVAEEDVETIKSLLQKHANYLAKIWEPFKLEI